jgi:hypothetical protein
MQQYLFIILALLLGGYALYRLYGSWKSVLSVAGGWFSLELLNFFLDGPVWVFMIGAFGIVTGTIAMIFIAFFVNSTQLIVYQKIGQDLLGVEAVEKIKSKSTKWSNNICNHKNLCIRIPLYIPAKLLNSVSWLLSKNDATAFFVLTAITQDSFIVTTFLRHGRFGKLKLRDWTIFISSTLIGCVIWSGVLGIAFEGMKQGLIALIG